MTNRTDSDCFPQQDAPDVEAAQRARIDEDAAQNLEEQCRAVVCPACEVKREADDVRLRALAEMENFKKRLQREHDEQIRYATETSWRICCPRWTALIWPSATEAARPPAKTC